MQEAEEGRLLGICSQPGLPSEFQASRGYTVRYCLKQRHVCYVNNNLNKRHMCANWIQFAVSHISSFFLDPLIQLFHQIQEHVDHCFKCFLQHWLPLVPMELLLHVFGLCHCPTGHWGCSSHLSVLSVISADLSFSSQALDLLLSPSSKLFTPVSALLNWTFHSIPLYSLYFSIDSSCS